MSIELASRIVLLLCTHAYNETARYYFTWLVHLTSYSNVFSLFTFIYLSETSQKSIFVVSATFYFVYS